MTRQSGKKAVIYCRVSSAKQTTRGDGLGSQETRCRQYAEYRGHEVAEVFVDDKSGSIVGRPGMKAMLSYLRKSRKNSHVVIIDDISRLARGLEAHLTLRADIISAGGILESPSIEFGEDSDSQLVEHLLASVSQHQRQKNGEVTLNRMVARAQNGWWVFAAPWGLRYEKAPAGGKMLVRDEPLASIIQDALERYATGNLSSQAEVKRFFEMHPEFPPCRHGMVLNDRVRQILTQPLYAGMLAVPSWNIPLRKAQHTGLISFETWTRIQERLAGKARAPARVDLNLAFPLRGAVSCDDCGHPLTANFSKGEFKSYAYYLCRQRDCISHGKSIARDKVEGAFEELLKSLVPARELFDLATVMFRDMWNAHRQKGAERRTTLEKEIRDIDHKSGVLLDRIVESESRAVIGALESRVEELNARKILLNEKIANLDAPKHDYDTTFRTALQFLSSPWNLWKSDRIEDKRACLKLTFADNLRYHRKEGLRTPKTSLPFKMLGNFSPLKGELARPERFERPTLRFVV